MHDKYHNLPTTDDDRAELALFELLKIMFSPVEERMRIQAASLVLRYCLPPPLRRSHVTIDAFEDWIEEVAKDDAAEQGA
ncbi:MAG: hypothetical protein U1E81_20235 [Xanthobacteraceae bacterium]